MVVGWLIKETGGWALPCSAHRGASLGLSDRQLWPLAAVPQPELMLTTSRARATLAGLDSSQEYALRILLLNGTAEKLLAKRQFTSKERRQLGVVSQQAGIHLCRQIGKACSGAGPLLRLAPGRPLVARLTQGLPMAPPGSPELIT